MAKMAQMVSMPQSRVLTTQQQKQVHHSQDPSEATEDPLLLSSGAIRPKCRPNGGESMQSLPSPVLVQHFNCNCSSRRTKHRRRAIVPQVGLADHAQVPLCSTATATIRNLVLGLLPAQHGKNRQAKQQQQQHHHHHHHHYHHHYHHHQTLTPTKPTREMKRHEISLAALQQARIFRIYSKDLDHEADQQSNSKQIRSHLHK